MEYTVKNKQHVYDMLYPFAARALGLKNLIMRNNADFSVRYHSNRYCTDRDNADNAMHKLTVECDFGKAGKVFFIPFSVLDADIYGYNVFVADENVAKIGPYEWEIIRPKVYGNFTEYFSEFSSAIDAYQYVRGLKAAQPFILNHYGHFFSSFRSTLYSRASEFEADTLESPVTFNFNSDDIYGVPVHEQTVVTKTADNRIMLAIMPMN